jgi:hypothetical protein
MARQRKLFLQQNYFPFVKMSLETFRKIQHLEGSLEMTLSWGIFLPFILEENLGDSGRGGGRDRLLEANNMSQYLKCKICE